MRFSIHDLWFTKILQSFQSQYIAPTGCKGGFFIHLQSTLLCSLTSFLQSEMIAKSRQLYTLLMIRNFQQKISIRLKVHHEPNLFLLVNCKLNINQQESGSSSYYILLWKTKINKINKRPLGHEKKITCPSGHALRPPG